MKQSVTYVYFIHANPFERVGQGEVLSPDKQFRLQNLIKAISARILNKKMRIKLIAIDSKEARSVCGSLFKAFEIDPQYISGDASLSVLKKAIDEDCTIVIFVDPRKESIQKLSGHVCTQFGIPPCSNFMSQSFPDGSMLEVNITGGRVNVLTGKSS